MGSHLNRRKWLAVAFVSLLLPQAALAGSADNITDLLNAQYGAICSARLEGWFSKTLVIDWTARTTKLHAVRVLSEVSSVKSALYEDGVRYFKFPNDAGGYNIIDWKTGEKESVNERAPYYFR